MVDPDREASLRRAIEELYFGYRAFTALPDKMLAERGLGRTHHRILYFVRRDPEISVGELLAVLEVTKQAIHRPVRDLEERGLLAVAGDPRDGRVRRLSVTAAGADLEAQLTAAQMRLLDRAFDGLGESAEQHWHQVMQRLEQEPNDIVLR
jgi:DNA-binding MarR family transcriptional regulator